MVLQSSPLSPWLTLLPEKLSTPLHYSSAQLEHLRGTTLHAATRPAALPFTCPGNPASPVVSYCCCLCP